MNRFSITLAAATVSALALVVNAPVGAHAADWNTSKTPTNADEFAQRFNAGIVKAATLGIAPDTRCWPDEHDKAGGGHACDTNWIRVDKDAKGATMLTISP